MPVSLRPKGKISKIVEAIKGKPEVGKPDNGKKKKSPKEIKLTWEESKRF